MGDLSISIRGVVPFALATRTYQVGYRNAAESSTASTFDSTNGSSVMWEP